MQSNFYYYIPIYTLKRCRYESYLGGVEEVIITYLILHTLLYENEHQAFRYLLYHKSFL